MKNLITITIILHTTLSFATNYYVDATFGNDNNSGTSPDSAWQTIEKVNNAALLPGDYVLFKRGEIFRGNLLPISGAAPQYITYGAYGTGNKPKIFGSYNHSSTSHWIDEGENIWRTIHSPVSLTGPELLPNPDFDDNISDWYLYNNSTNGASSELLRTSETDEYFTSPGGGKLVCQNNGEFPTDIQVYTFNWSITKSKWYKLTFKAKATEQFTLSSTNITLMMGSSPWTNYSSVQTRKDITFTTSWATYELIYKINTSASDARITFKLGNIIPDGVTFYFDSLSFKEISGNPGLLIMDVGNIVFNNEGLCGLKVWKESDLDNQNEFWYDANNEIVKLYSISNPGSFYSDIELALRQNIIDISNKSYIIFEKLDIRYGAAHGIAGTSSHHIWIRDVNFSYIGGGDQYGGTDSVRYGNGIEFWKAAHDNIVERCTFNQVYDAAMSPQGFDDSQGFEVYNLYFKNNIVNNCEYTFEFWARSVYATVNDVYFVNNTCLNAGGSWGHEQRPDGTNGTHIMIWNNYANTSSFYIMNNIFYNSTDWGVRWNINEDVSDIIMDNNCWFETSGNIARIEDSYFDYALQWDEYKTITGHDVHSVASDPLLNIVYSLQTNSPCIDAGIPLSIVTHDFDSISRPQESEYDIGAFEYLSSTAIKNNSNTELMVYSDAVYDKLIVIIPEATKISMLSIYNLNGQQLLRQQINQTKTEINTGSFPDGIYIVQIINNNTNSVKKVFIR